MRNGTYGKLMGTADPERGYENISAGKYANYVFVARWWEKVWTISITNKFE